MGLAANNELKSHATYWPQFLSAMPWNKISYSPWMVCPFAVAQVIGTAISLSHLTSSSPSSIIPTPQLRKEKFGIRYLRRAMTYYFDEIGKDKSIYRVRDLLIELPRQENTVRGLLGKPNSSLCEMENRNGIDRSLARIRSETVEALRTLM